MDCSRRCRPLSSPLQCTEEISYVQYLHGGDSRPCNGHRREEDLHCSENCRQESDPRPGVYHSHGDDYLQHDDNGIGEHIQGMNTNCGHDGDDFRLSLCGRRHIRPIRRYRHVSFSTVFVVAVLTTIACPDRRNNPFYVVVVKQRSGLCHISHPPSGGGWLPLRERSPNPRPRRKSSTSPLQMLYLTSPETYLHLSPGEMGKRPRPPPTRASGATGKMFNTNSLYRR